MEREKRTMKSTDPLALSAAAFVEEMAEDPRFVLIKDGPEKWGRDLVAEGMTDREQDHLLIYALKTFVANGGNYS